ncbi:hypothetical protein [Streptomyces meridianus]|uniref:Uncharacterized protein n=1 Tax=Streptomyces meridianus TaxID=2938945 RepID=A0ABT0XB04_9ACTN|nr:hypothetical protein [Streptomyces meridianus]MCM2579123.1 hypothetical protein [Streptomyces meridianus]
MSDITLLRIFAVVSGIALGGAMATMTAKKKRKLAAVVVPLVATAVMVGQSILRGYDEGTALRLYTLAVLDLVLMRVVFSGWLRRQSERQTAGLPPQEPKLLHFLVFFPVFVGGVVLIAFCLSQVESLLT